MERVEIVEKVKTILTNYSDLKPEEMNEKSRLIGDLGLTSFDLICLGGSLEDVFKVKLEDSMMNSLQTIEDVVKLIEG